MLFEPVDVEIVLNEVVKPMVASSVDAYPVSQRLGFVVAKARAILKGVEEACFGLSSEQKEEYKGYLSRVGKVAAGMKSESGEPAVNIIADRLRALRHEYDRLNLIKEICRYLDEFNNDPLVIRSFIDDPVNFMVNCREYHDRRNNWDAIIVKKALGPVGLEFFRVKSNFSSFKALVRSKNGSSLMLELINKLPHHFKSGKDFMCFLEATTKRHEYIVRLAYEVAFGAGYTFAEVLMWIDNALNGYSEANKSDACAVALNEMTDFTNIDAFYDSLKRARWVFY